MEPLSGRGSWHPDFSPAARGAPAQGGQAAPGSQPQARAARRLPGERAAAGTRCRRQAEAKRPRRASVMEKKDPLVR